MTPPTNVIDASDPKFIDDGDPSVIVAASALPTVTIISPLAGTSRAVPTHSALISNRAFMVHPFHYSDIWGRSPDTAQRGQIGYLP
jgi:hypothetical protein